VLMQVLHRMLPLHTMQQGNDARVPFHCLDRAAATVVVLDIQLDAHTLPFTGL
jgi:hypothetical protein